MPSDEDAHASETQQSVSAGNDAYAAGRDNVITQHIYPAGTLPPATEVNPHADDDPWTQIARDHVAWRKAAAMPGRDELQSASLAVIASLHLQYAAAVEACRDDPWLDEEVPVRMAEEVGTLLRHLPDALLLSPAEAALLTVAPFLRATWWMGSASEQWPTDPPRNWLADDTAPLARFARSYPWLSRTFAAAPENAAGPIGWWIFRRWLDREPGAYLRAMEEHQARTGREAIQQDD
jgi:hypothetical protein